MEIGESGKVRIGQQVLAIGNPFGFDHTLTTGTPYAVHDQTNACICGIKYLAAIWVTAMSLFKSVTCY